MAAARNHHVMVLVSHVGGNEWLVHDGNSWAGLTRDHGAVDQRICCCQPARHLIENPPHLPYGNKKQPPRQPLAARRKTECGALPNLKQKSWVKRTHAAAVIRSHNLVCRVAGGGSRLLRIVPALRRI